MYTVVAQVVISERSEAPCSVPLRLLRFFAAIDSRSADADQAIAFLQTLARLIQRTGVSRTTSARRSCRLTSSPTCAPIND
jgi:hypothetical protein